MTRRLALVVANDSYRDEALSSLFSPVHDAQSLRDLLRDPEIGGFDPADILVNESKAEIERSMERLFLTAEPGDLVTLYFSGHGVRSRSGRLHLAVANTELNLLASTSVSASFVKELTDESDASSTVVLLDCCYSGAFTEGGLKSDPQIDVGRELQAGRGTYVLTASSSVESAGDGDAPVPGRPRSLSVFTEAVVRGLSTGAADVRGVGRITPNDLWEYVRQEVPRRSIRQTPTQYGYVEDEIHLANVRRSFPTAAAPGGQRVHLGDLLGPLSQTAEQGLRAEEWLGSGRLVVPIGQVFRGAERAEPVWLDLAQADGHVLVVGRIGSGKSTLLRTLIGALALTHTPDEVRFYFLESGGNKLGSLRRLPFVAGLAGDDEGEAVGRLLHEIQAVIARRKRLFRTHDIDSSTRFRAMRDRLPDGPHPDIFLVIDRWAEFAGHEEQVRVLASGGLEYGVHVIVAARRWAEVPDQLQELVHCHVELALARPGESRVDPRLAEQLPVDRPGWALLRRSRFLVARPDLRTAIGPPMEVLAADASDGALDLVERVTRAWSRVQARASSMPPGTVGSSPTAQASPTSMPPPPTSGLPPTAQAGASSVPPAGTYGVSPTVLDLLGLDGPDADRARQRVERTPQERLRVPIGVDEHGKPVVLDLKEAAQGGMGPHGLIVGATGSGKSELLRTLVTGLALTHGSERVNFAFIDFKGGAVFAPFAELPHTVAMVTNLADDLTLVDRLSEAISGELVRRQEALRAAGNLASQRDYEAVRAGGRDLPAMPSLVIICDEFSELLSANPEMVDLFVMIGRLGRSLGVHLLLATQRMEEGRLRGIDTHLSYRIGLRTFSAMESRAVLGIPDAYELPRAPGHGYLRHGGEPPTRFLAATSFDAQTGGPQGGESVSLAEAVVRTLRETDPLARRVWLPPLRQSPTLDELLGEVTTDPARGLTVADPALRTALRVPVGLVDKPYEQRRDPLWLSFHGNGRGNLAVVGGPRGGKSTLLRTLVCALALTHTPAEVHVYCLAFGDDGQLHELRHLPHVGGVAGTRDSEAVRRTIGDLVDLLAVREAQDAPPGHRWPAVFLLVDGWATVRSHYEDTEPAITDLITRGPAYGIHVVAAASRWMDVRPAVRDMFGSRLELRLADPSDSMVRRKTAASVPAGAPGRGITTDGHHFLAALPELSTVDGGAPGLVREVTARWAGQSAPRVRLLPSEVPYDALTEVETERLRLPIGIAEADLQRVSIDFASEPNLLLFGDPESGKSSFLRALATSITTRFTPQQARVILVDYRRSLLGVIESDHLLGYGTSAQSTASLIDSVVTALQERLPGVDVTPQQLRDRSWWTGPELFVLVDDYDLVATGSGNPLLPLQDYLAQARDVGLHLVLARRSGGAARSLYDPIIQRLRELASPGLVMSGDPNEGPVLGTVRPSPLPPGRARLVTRREGVRLVQLAYLPPAEE